MPDLKLGKLPDRTPVKMSITIAPELHVALQDYGSIYALTYGVEEPLSELVPAMLSAFLETDRNFLRARDARGRAGR